MAAAAKTDLDVFSEPPMLFQYDRTFYREISPVSAIQRGSPIEFVIPGTAGNYLDLARTFAIVKAKITKADGSNLAADAAVGVVNNPLHSAFSNIGINLNGKELADQNGLYPYRAYFEKLLSFEKDAQESHLQTCLWQKDKAGKLNEFAIADNAPNPSFKWRADFFKESAEVEMADRLHIDLVNQPRLLGENNTLRLKFTPSKDSFILKTPAPAGADAQVAYQFNIASMNLYVRTVQVAAPVVEAQQKMLMSHNMKYPHRHVEVKHLAVPAGQTTMLHDNIYLGRIPRRVLVSMVRDDAMAGHYNRNPFNLEHFNLNQIVLYVNGEPVPSRPYSPDFANKRFLRDYMSLFLGTDTMFTNRSINISREEYPAGYTLWIFDLTPDVATNPCFTVPRNGSVRLELKFAQATAQTVNVICYGEFDSILEIDKFHNAIAP